jgi:hypothetical protein
MVKGRGFQGRGLPVRLHVGGPVIIAGSGIRISGFRCKKLNFNLILIFVKLKIKTSSKLSFLCGYLKTFLVIPVVPVPENVPFYTGNLYRYCTFKNLINYQIKRGLFHIFFVKCEPLSELGSAVSGIRL